MKRTLLSISLSILLAVSTVLTAACGFINDLKAAEGGEAVVTTELVRTNVITGQAKIDIDKDFGDIVNLTSQLNTDVGAATTTPQKLDAWQKFADGLAAVVARGHFLNVPYISDAVVVIDGIVAVAKGFYSPATPGVPKAGPQTEKDLQKQIEARIKTLKLTLTVHK